MKVRVFLTTLMVVMLLSSFMAPYAVAQGPTLAAETDLKQPETFDGVTQDRGRRVRPAADPDDVLWDQFNPTGTSNTSQDFEAGYDAYDSWSADDFENTEPWLIDTIMMAGGWTGVINLSGAHNINWWICPDNGGEPLCYPPGDGNEYWGISLPPSDPQVTIVDDDDALLTLDTPIMLPPGHWWLSIQAELDFGVYGQWGWTTTLDPVWGDTGKLANPNGGFGLPPGWNEFSAPADCSFRLEGVIDTQGPNFEESFKAAPPTIEWLEPLTYTVVIRNTGGEPGLATVMTDVLPAGTEFISGSLSCDSGTCWYDDVDNAVYWEGEVPAPAKAGPEGWQPEAPVAPEGGYNPAAVADLVGGVEPAAFPAPEGTGPIWNYPEAVLWDNGPLVTHPGACSGMDASRLQTGLSMNTLGFGHQFALGYRMADDFEIVDAGGWDIDQITFFAYQTNGPVSPSPITGVYYQIWDGPPDDPASSVVFGDLVTNRLLSSDNPNLQRDSETSPCANNRYIFADVASAGVHLDPGIYWLDWMTDGSLTSGPWAPPITILGETTTGNALQYTTAWAPALDSGTSTQQGMPFIIEGTAAQNEVAVEFAVETPGVPCGEIIHNEAVIYDPEAPGAVVVAAETSVIGPPLFMEDFEGGLGNWAMTGLWNEEHEGDTCGSLVTPFPSSDTGAYYGIDGICTYNNGAANAGELAMIMDVDLSQAANAGLFFWSYEETECGYGNCGFDNRYVDVSTDGGVIWTTVWGSMGPEGQWYEASADLSAFVGGPLRVRFRFDTGDAIGNDYFGWLVDNVAIHSCGVPIIEVDPDALESVQYPDQVILQMLDVSNVGANLLLWNFFETPPPKGPEALLFYYDRGVFDTDWPGLPVEGFENTLVPDFSVLACDGPFNSSTNNACFAPGGILDGISLMNVDPTLQMVVLGDGFLGPHTAIVGPNTFVDHHDVFFDPPVEAVGFDVVSPFAPGDVLDIYVYGPGDILLGQDTFSMGDFPPSFWGVASAPEPITRIRTESAAGNGELFDDIAFGGGPMLECGVDWATPSPDAGMNMPGVTTPVEVAFDSTGLGLGVYTGTLCIESNDPATPIVPVPVTMTVEPPPDIVVDPTELHADLCPDATQVLTFSICNTGIGDLDWGVTEIPVDMPWLSEDPIAGVVLPAECQVVDVTFDATGLAPGDYGGDLLIDSNDPDTPTMTLPVTLTVLEPVAIDDVVWTPDGCQVSFDSTVMGLEPIAYSWDFGDGVGTSVDADPVYTYTTPGGTFTVTLDVSNECGTDMWSDTIEVSCSLPYHHIYLPIIVRE